MVNIPKYVSELDARLKEQEAHRAGRIVGDAAEVG
jgi:hypothetical protein